MSGSCLARIDSVIPSFRFAFFSTFSLRIPNFNVPHVSEERHVELRELAGLAQAVFYDFGFKEVVKTVT